jgi:YVTN family beta-propeller protein
MSGVNPRMRNATVAGSTAIVAAAAAAVSLTLAHGGPSPTAKETTGKTAAAKAGSAKTGAARLIDSSCGGPAGAAYVMDAGWDGFSAINTANCQLIQTYNVGDTPVSGDPGDQNYSSTNEGIAVSGNTLYIADTGTDTVSVIDAATLDPSNYNPAETDIHVGFNPQALAVTPNGSQLWVADTGPQTAPSSPTDVSVIDTATNKVTATIPVKGAPSQVAFSPSGKSAYVVTADGLYTFSTATRKETGNTRGLGDPRGIAVSPDGKTVYVTGTADNTLKVISASDGRVVTSIPVGDLPWQVVVSANGSTAYVANPDSDSVSVISTATDTVTKTITLTGDPDTLALTPGGSQLWVGQLASAYVTLIDTSGDSVVGSINLGGSEPQSGDGYEPTGIALVSTPTPGS